MIRIVERGLLRRQYVIDGRGNEYGPYSSVEETMVEGFAGEDYDPPPNVRRFNVVQYGIPTILEIEEDDDRRKNCIDEGEDWRKNR